MDPNRRIGARTLVASVRRGLAACVAAPGSEGFGNVFELGMQGAGGNLYPDIDDDYQHTWLAPQSSTEETL